MTRTAAVSAAEAFTPGEGPLRDDRLLITTATAGLDARQPAAYPMSGRLFLAEVGVTGLPVTPWAGPIPGES